MKSVSRLKGIVEKLNRVAGNVCTDEYTSRKRWRTSGCMEHVKFDTFRGVWIKPPSTKVSLPMSQVKQYKSTLNRMVGRRLAVEYDKLSLYIPKSLPIMQRYLVLCQWRAIWHRPGYVYLFNHYVENGVDPFDAMFILQSHHSSWTKAGSISMPMASPYIPDYDHSALTRWKQAWLHNKLINVEASTNTYNGDRRSGVKDLYDIEGSVKPFIKSNSKPVPSTAEVFPHSVGDVVHTNFAGIDMYVEILQIDNHDINPYRGIIVGARTATDQIFHIPMASFIQNA